MCVDRSSFDSDYFIIVPHTVGDLMSQFFIVKEVDEPSQSARYSVCFMQASLRKKR